jgi:hypothetical protein
MALGTPQIPTSNEVKSTLLSFFGRASYAYREKYLAVVTMRYDGSSKFAEGRRCAPRREIRPPRARAFNYQLKVAGGRYQV